MPEMILPTGTEYELLQASLHLEIPWATVDLGTTGPAAESEAPGHPAERIAAARARVVASRAASGPPVLLCEVVRRTARADSVRIAMAGSSRTMTYAEFDERTDRVAALVRRHGVRRGELVVIAFGRGFDLVEAMIGVWKAGAAFLCLDPAAPLPWREDAARRAGASLVLAAAADVVPGLTHLHPAAVAAAEPIAAGPIAAEPIAAGPIAAGPVEQQPGDLAYVIQTSGSTGAPKLVMVDHGGLGNLVRALPGFVPGLGAGSRVLQFSAPTFDAVIFDLALSLGQGGRLEVLDDLDTVADATAALPVLLRQRKVTHAMLTAVVVRTLAPGTFPDLTVLMSGGEACQPDTASAWAPHLLFLNCYGPAETSVCATAQPVVPGERLGGSVPIGRALPGCHVVLVDAGGAPVPDGREGEICIGGDGVGPGYLGQDAETALRFVPDPFSPVVGARLYRSGDLGRMRPDGTVEFLGRRDHQVKVRGVRIELAEVERLLAELPTVGDAVATVERSAGGELRLLGYVRPTGGATAAEVLAELRRTVPKHLVPSVLTVVEEWPLSTSGKIDRGRLPRPAPQSSAAYVAPRTPVEETLALIAAELLGLPRVGIHDNFFELGGHSLLATQLIARAHTALGRVIELSAVLQGATIATISASLDDPGAGADVLAPPVPGVRGSGGRTPSLAQQRIWLMQEMRLESVAYNSQFAIRFGGALDLESLCASLTDIVERHEVLRTRFFVEDGELRCEVVDPWRVELPVLDLAGVGPEERNRRFAAAVREIVGTPFAIDRERLVRWLLVRTGPDDHTLVYVEHHTVHDGWSINVFMKDMLAGYVDHQRFGEVRRPALRLQYYDHAEWQYRWCASEQAQRQRQFWRTTLEGASGLLPLPGRARTGERRFRGAAPRLEIDAELARDLQGLSERTGGTLYMTLLAAFFALLHRYSGARDLLTCSGIANRRWQDTEDLMGMFVNTVVFRGAVPDDEYTFGELLAQVRKTALGVYDNQELPFEQVLEEAGTRRVDGVNPLVQTMFNVHDAPHRELESLPLEVVSVEAMSNGSAKFDLNVIVIPHHNMAGHIGRGPGNVCTFPVSTGPLLPSPKSALDGITLSWEYDSDRFDPAFIVGMLEAYLGILRAVVADTDVAVSRLPLLTGRASTELLRLGAGPEAPAALPLSTLIEQQVRRAPEAVAVVSGGAELTYAEVSRRADGLAGRLRAAGIGGGSTVALCLASSPELVVALLGVLRAGAGFVALEPGYPVARVEWLLRDSGAAVVVTTEALAHLVPESSALPIVPVDGPDGGPGTWGPENPHDIAYLCYTSGSTGVPKGVQVEHHSVVAKLANMAYFSLAPGKSVLQVAPPALDVAVMETLGALAHGATIHVPRAGWNLRELGDYLLDHRITHVWLIAPLLHQLAGEVPEALDRTEQVLTGADVVSPAVVRRLLERGVREVVNGYGPTETTMFSSAFHARSPQDVDTSVPIGSTVPLVRISLRDERLGLVPRGVVGELCIGGAGVARGYRNRPEQDARAFVDTPDGRVYRTGDMARWRPDGTLEFLGRRDSQVKVRGYRIELGEIVAALTELAQVKDAIALTEPFGEGDHRLIAYVVATPGHSPSGEDVRSALRATVPGHLVPSVVVVLDAFPLTVGGKVDRALLPVARPERSVAPVGPRTPAERTLAGIVADVLGLAEVGVEDNFFELGGHSLLATKLLARVRAATGADVRLDAFFAAPTVARLAESLEVSASAAPGPVRRQPRRSTAG